MATWVNAVGVTLRDSAQSTNSYSVAFNNQTVNGTSGADAFWGQSAFASTLIGGAGDDSYFVPELTSRPVEQAGGGVDTVTVWWRDYTLGDNIENLVVNGEAKATGNGLDNVMRGDDARQTINGGAGNDVLIGGGGADTFVVSRGNGSDVIVDFQGGAGGDLLRLDGYSFASFAAFQGAMRQVGADIVIALGAESLVLRNQTIAQITPQNVQLPIDLSGARSVFADEFDSLSLRSASPTNTWKTTYYWGDRTLPGNAERQFYVDPAFAGLGLNPFSTADGVLTISANPASSAVKPLINNLDYTSGLITSEQSFSMQYGYFEMRADLPGGRGLWPAFWLLPINGDWPPEIDVMEMIGDNPTTLFTTMHTKQTGSHTSAGAAITVPNMTEGFHTYGVNWQRDRITWYFDGMEVFSTATPADMHQPMYMLANLAVGGNWPGSPDASTPFPAQMQIDYIRAYQMPPTRAAVPIPSSWAAINPATAFSTLDGTGARVAYDWSTTLGAGETKLRLSGDGARYAIGNDLANYIEGSAAQYNELMGGRGNDVLRGGAGIDVFVVRDGDGNDVILDLSNTPGNTDKIRLEGFHFTHFAEVRPWMTQVGADVMLRLDADQALLLRNVTLDQLRPEQFVFLNSVAPPVDTVTTPIAPTPPPPTTRTLFTLPTSGATTTTFTGTTGADTLTGTSGADSLDGRAGIDRMSGGAGNDTYRVDNPLDVIVELAGGGIDSVNSDATSYTLPDHVENLNLWGRAQRSGTGNAGDNRIVASYGDATLNGMGGNDILMSGRGFDTLTGGAGTDIFALRFLTGGRDRITDFQDNVDMLDLRELMREAGYTGRAPIADGYLAFRSNGAGGTDVWVDADGRGAGAATHVAVVDNIAPSALTFQVDWFV